MPDTGLLAFILAAMRATPDQIARARRNPDALARKYDIPADRAVEYLNNLNQGA